MNAPFNHARGQVGQADLGDAQERMRIDAFLAEQPGATPFHRPEWLLAVARGTGNPALALVAEQDNQLCAYLPLTETHSPLFGRMLAASGFAVGGGLLLSEGIDAGTMFGALEELAARRSVTTIELRGGALPQARAGWSLRGDAHCGFVAPLAADDEALLLAVPRKQRAELRKSLDAELDVTVGAADSDRRAHYGVYAESVRNLGTPVFPRALFDAVLDAFGADADILTIRSAGRPVASVLSLYHRGAVLPYWGGGTHAARRLRANDRMYFELMRHARRRGCDRFDFGRSKTGSGPYHFKRNWGFTPEPLTYAVWTAPGAPARDANPNSAGNSALAALWRRLPLAIANHLGPPIARGLG
ncbi:MAG: FemAB family XrtA/PEP-CTERM system-associated protein [Novosphingobium sp.]